MQLQYIVYELSRDSHHPIAFGGRTGIVTDLNQAQLYDDKQIAQEQRNIFAKLYPTRFFTVGVMP